MGNCTSLWFNNVETNHEANKNSATMVKDVVHKTTPFDGQKPGTSGNNYKMNAHVQV